MRISVMISGDIKQIMLAPEDKTEEAIVNLFHSGEISVSTNKVNIEETRGGYLRQFERESAVVLTIKPKQEESAS